MNHNFGIYPRLDNEDLPAALALWRAGKNTAEIAKFLLGSKKCEASVANSLAAEREKRRRAA